MPESSHEFANISHFVPETFGEPGKRTFRINVVSESSDAKLWMILDLTHWTQLS